MAIRRTGRFLITDVGTGTQSGDDVTGVSGEYTGVAGATLGTDIAVGDYLHATTGSGVIQRWRVSAITAATATTATLDLSFDDPSGNFPASDDANPIGFGESVITEPISPGGASAVPSQSQLQIAEQFVQGVNTTNAFYESGGLQPNSDGVYDLENRNVTGAELISCLLYTSPSPRDRTRSRMPSSA